MSKKSKREYLQEISLRYNKACKEEKIKILDEFCSVCSYHRKYAIKLLNQCPLVKINKQVNRSGRKKKYHTIGVIEFLKIIWKKSNLICSDRLKAAIPIWLPRYKKVISEISKGDEELLRSISASTIDRILSKFRGKYTKRGLCTTRPGSIIRDLIPIKTNQWDENRPGFIEIDLVAHCGTSVSGEYINTLNIVDIATGWTSQRAVWGKGEANTFKAIREIELTLPFKIRGVDSDNGKEFMNYRLLKYFKHRKEPVNYTRSRAYNKNDNAHIEEKNWTVVRQYIGYDRLNNPEQLGQLNDLYRNELNYFLNYFLPSVKLISKERQGSKIKKKYDKAKTPFQRLFESKEIDEETKLELLRISNRLDPFKLQSIIEEKIRLILKLSVK
ncbi:MAG TPA: integrase [Ignavibacteria bacterium]|nr:integrase [Ignavibacteria bacterium]